jgi:hypothetical protein
LENHKYQIPKMTCPAAEQRVIYNGFATPQAAGNKTLVRLRRIQTNDNDQNAKHQTGLMIKILKLVF